MAASSTANSWSGAFKRGLDLAASHMAIQRIWRALDRYRIKSSVVMNSRVAERYPYLVEKINQRGDEIIAGALVCIDGAVVNPP